MSDDIKTRARRFADEWRDRGDENSDTQQYWLDLLEHVLDVKDVNRRETVTFERRTAANGRIDALMTDARVLVEQKSSGVDLDKPEPRQGEMKTPVKQALDYANALPPSEKPDIIIVCGFDRFRLYDLESDPLARAPQSEFRLEDLPDHVNELARLFDHEHSRVVQTERLSVEAGRRVARLHAELAACWPDPDEPAAHEAIAMTTVRIVFNLYAEDAGLYRRDQFLDYVRSSTPDRLAADLYDLFAVLDTTPEHRRRFLPDRLNAFRYVDGGLFDQPIDIPPLTEELHKALIDISEGFDWSGISPVIFGSLMEETLSHDERRRGGMHYTSVENIHKVIDPLFLDGLKADLEAAEAKPVAGGARTKALNQLHDRIAGLRFLDPACGSGNFLTETYLCLRRLENRILNDLASDGQLMLDLEDMNPVKVSIDHMYGIEINTFACAVARTALWIAEQQALDDTESIVSGIPRLPFTDSGHIIQANALRYDWNSLLSGDRCDYVMGNPPFVGHVTKTRTQTDDLRTVWGDDYDGYLDYATGWYRKASRYLTNPTAAFSFVSTNSITQGQPVPALFRPLAADGWRIMSAHRTFAWNAQSTDNAHVHVVVIGMDRADDATKPPVLFEYPDIDGEPEATHPRHVNGYLLDGPDVYAEKRSQKAGPLSPMLPRVSFGSLSLDDGNLTLDSHAEYEEAMTDPIAAKYVREYRNGRELINGLERWCLWLVDAPASDILESRFLRRRVEAVRTMRMNAKRPKTVECAATPHLFGENHQPNDTYLAVPVVFSARRPYATCAILPQSVIAGQKLHTGIDPDGFTFAVTASKMFITWQKAIGGRLKSDCQFSNTVVWNTLPLPKLSDAMRGKVIEAGRVVIEARANHPGESLADLYSPLLMHPDLIKAHENLDKIVDVAFGADRWLRDDNDARLEVLFDSYARMTAAEG